jgi:nanoRNase/pAp phosphatase (c-di-AMP/oligoRNAs hydrolase)
LVKSVAKSAYHVEFMGYTVLAVNSNSLISDVGGYLAEIHPPFAIVWSEHGTHRRYSLRSRGQVDVSKLASKFNHGGGHPNAAGFSLPISEPFPWKLVKHHNHNVK